MKQSTCLRLHEVHLLPNILVRSVLFQSHLQSAIQGRVNVLPEDVRQNGTNNQANQQHTQNDEKLQQTINSTSLASINKPKRTKGRDKTLKGPRSHYQGHPI